MAETAKKIAKECELECKIEGEKYLEKNAEAINNGLDVVMYASKQEELRGLIS